MTIVGLIPARGGSKRVPGKNLAPCAGKPLLAWTAEAALASRRLQRVVLSTDDQAIAEAGRMLGLDVPFLRPPVLSGDDVSMAPVMRHALEWITDHGDTVEALVLLQPSSPLRQAHHIDDAVDLFFESGVETLISVVEVPHIFHPAKLQCIEAGRLQPYDEATDLAQPFYGRNGPAILINQPAVIARGERYGSTKVAYLMSPEDSVDIDEPFDLAFAEFMLQRRQSTDQRAAS